MKLSSLTTPNTVAIVTGAGTGIGRAVTLALLQEGYSVALAGRRLEPLKQVVNDAGVSATRTLVVPTDVSDAEAVRILFAKTKDAFGRLGWQPRCPLWAVASDINADCRPRRLPERRARSRVLLEKSPTTAIGPPIRVLAKFAASSVISQRPLR